MINKKELVLFSLIIFISFYILGIHVNIWVLDVSMYLFHRFTIPHLLTNTILFLLWIKICYISGWKLGMLLRRKDE